MSLQLHAQERSSFGKCANATLRASGHIPCVVYPYNGSPSIHFSISKKEALLIVNDVHALTRLFGVKFGKEEFLALVKELQFDPVTDLPVHIDFVRMKEGEKAIVDMPIRVKNRALSVGVKRGGDVFLVKHSVKVMADVSTKPLEVVIDAAGSQIGDKFRLSNSILPNGAGIINDELLAKVAGKRGAVGSEATQAGDSVASAGTVASKK